MNKNFTKHSFTVFWLVLFLFITNFVFAQQTIKESRKKNKLNITGVWQGHFLQKEYNPFTGRFVEDAYKYEVQINNLQNQALEGVTYSYQTTRFYGKASLQGLFTVNTNNVVIKETKMLELKVTGNSEACLMTCYLDYEKIGNKEYLKGEYSSVNVRTKKPCGDGTVYLEKVPESDFVKEDFLLKKEELPKKVPNQNYITAKKGVKPGAENALVSKPTPKKVDKTEENKAVKSSVEYKDEVIATENVNKTNPKPEKVVPELTKRKNNLAKTIYVDAGEIEIELYDNGTIDNDTVSIYHNGNPVVLKGRLSTRPLTAKILVTAQEPLHEIIMVAENLGEIPPNTSLMVIKAGKKTYQAFITSDLQTNAKVIFEYKPDLAGTSK
jgi:hypothetical protein